MGHCMGRMAELGELGPLLSASAKLFRTSTIQEVPGHLFLKSEKADLVNFIEVGLISGWDMHLIPSAGSRHVFVSHDEWVEFALNDRVRAEQISADLKSAELKIYSFGRRLPLDR